MTQAKAGILLLEWTEKQKRTARRLETGVSQNTCIREGLYNPTKVRKAMNEIIAKGLPRPWELSAPVPLAPAPSIAPAPSTISEPAGNNGKEDSTEVPIVSFDSRGDGDKARGNGDKASSSSRVRDTPPARNIKGSLFKVRMRGIDLEVTVEELLDIMELYWAFKEEGYVGTPMSLAKYCMIKIANLTDIKPKLYLEVING